MHNLLPGVLLGSADLLDDDTMKNTFEYEEELAELQATIAQLETKLNNAINLDFERRETIAKLTAENERLRAGVEGDMAEIDRIQGEYDKQFRRVRELKGEIERLKDGQGEPRLVSYATDMSTCTLTIGDGIGYFYDRVCTPVPVGFVAHRLDEIGQSHEGVIYAPAILEGAVKQGTLLYTRDNSTSTAEDKS